MPTVNDPFLQRAIEHWLDSANELTYQPLFCQWLEVSGFVLKYSIKNTHFEQGKDVVAVDPHGHAHAFQLKGGSINLKRWREEVKPEIDILIGGAIQHPQIDKASPHVSFLVTNGEIEDNVRVEILALNELTWKATPLRYWTRGDLLAGFQSMAVGIFPKDAKQYKQLIDLMFASGKGFPDVPNIYSCLRAILSWKDAKRPMEQRKRDIAAAVVYATVIAGPYRSEGNYASTVRVLVILLSLILHLVDKYDLPDRYWLLSYRLVWDDILTSSESLEREINEGAFEAVALQYPLHRDLMPYRKYTALSVICALKMAQCLANDGKWKSVLAGPLAAALERTQEDDWGEASFAPSMVLAQLYQAGGLPESAERLLASMLRSILARNGRYGSNEQSLLPPYYDVEFIVRRDFNLLESEIEGDYQFHSYYAWPIAEALISLDARAVVAESWKEMSFMRFQEFVPTDPSDLYLWCAETGENRTTLPPKSASWAELRHRGESSDDATVPASLRRFPEFAAFFMVVFPFRITTATMRNLRNAGSPLEDRK